MAKKSPPKPGKLFSLKEWLTLDDAAHHLSLIFDEEVVVADVLRLALDGHLTLSVWFVNKTQARKGRLVPLSECKMQVLPSLKGNPPTKTLPKSCSFTQDELPAFLIEFKEDIAQGNIYLTPDALHWSDNDEWLVQEDAVVSIGGIWDLPMVGGEKLDVEHRFQMETDGPAITLSNLEGAFVRQGETYCQLMEDFEENEFCAGSEASLEAIKEKIERDKLDKQVADALLEKHKINRQAFLKGRKESDKSSHYYPRAGLSQDAVWVVKTTALQEFERAVSDRAADKEKPLGKREETTLLNITGALLSLLLGKTPAGNPQSVFKDQAAVIDALLASHEGKAGIAKRTLEEKLAQAKRSLSSS